jgi:hypothetical protein
MKKLLQKFETLMMAVAFAEAGEFEAARQIAVEEDCEAGKLILSKTAEGRKALSAN